MNYDTLQYIEYKDDKSQDTDIWPNLRLIYSSGLDWTYFWLINCSILVQAILSPVSSLKATHPWKNGVFRVSVRRGSFLSLKKLISEQKISKGTKNKALHLFFWLFLIAEKKILALLCLHLKNVFFKNDIQYNEIKQTIQNTITSKDFLSSHLLKDRISNCVF